MEFKIKFSEFKRVVNNACLAIHKPKKDSGGIRIKQNDKLLVAVLNGKLFMTGWNATTIITSFAEVEQTDTEAEVVAYFDKMKSIASRGFRPGSDVLVAIETEPSCVISVSCQGVTFRMKCDPLDIVEVPHTAFTSFSEQTSDSVIVSTEKVVSDLMSNASSVLQNASWFGEFGTLISAQDDDGLVSFVTTDSISLLEQKLLPQEARWNVDLCIPGTVAAVAAKAISAKSPGKCEIRSDGEKILFNLDGTRVVSRLSEKKFPEYRKILSDYHVNPCATVSKKELLARIVEMTGSSGTRSKSRLRFHHPLSGDVKLSFVGSQPKLFDDVSSSVGFVVQDEDALSLPGYVTVFNPNYVKKMCKIKMDDELLVSMFGGSSQYASMFVAEKDVEPGHCDCITKSTYMLMPINQ